MFSVFTICKRLYKVPVTVLKENTIVKDGGEG